MILWELATFARINAVSGIAGSDLDGVFVSAWTNDQLNAPAIAKINVAAIRIMLINSGKRVSHSNEKAPVCETHTEAVITSVGQAHHGHSAIFISAGRRVDMSSNR